MFAVLPLGCLSDYVFEIFLSENRAINGFIANSYSGKTLRHRLLEIPHITSNTFHIDISNCSFLDICA